VSLNFTLKIHR